MAEKGWTHGGGGEGGEGRVSARNRSLTAVLHELSLSLSVFLYLSFLLVLADGYRARHATPCNTARCSSELRSSGRSWTFQWQQKRQRRSRDPLIHPGRGIFSPNSRSRIACPLTFFSGIQPRLNNEAGKEGGRKIENDPSPLFFILPSSRYL